jgi:phage baseplate assembly protein W
VSLQINPRFKCFDGPVVKREQGFFTPDTESTALKNSVLLCIMTERGSRPGNRNFGSRLLELIFEENDFVMQDLAYEYIEEALEFEPRVQIESVTARRDNNLLNISLIISEVGSNKQHQLEFGF